MNPDSNSLESDYDSSAYNSSLESKQGATVTNIAPGASPRTGKLNISLFRFNRVAVLLSLAAVIFFLVIGGIAFGYDKLHQSNKNTVNSEEANGNYKVGSNLSVQQASEAQLLKLGQTNQLAINGQLTVSGGLVLTPTNTAPSSPVPGEVYFDKATNQPYYYNGSSFVSLVQQQSVTSIGGVGGQISVGSGLQITSGGQLSLSSTALQSLVTPVGSGVTSLQGLTGSVSLESGSGIGINGTTITNQGVISVTSASTNLVVSQDGSGNYTLNDNSVVNSGSAGDIALITGGQTISGSILSQSSNLLTDSGDLLVSGNTVNSGNLTVDGNFFANTIEQTASGNNVSISAGTDSIQFTAGGRTFAFPTVGPGSQTICTSGASCGSGGGTAVQLQPGEAQIDTGTGSSIFINNTAGGNLIELQGAGNDEFVVNNSGNTTVGGTLEVKGSTTLDNNVIAKGTLTVQGTGVTVGSTSNNGVLSFLDGTSDGFTGKIELNGAIGANQTYQLPAASGGIICLNTGNCAGAGGGITGSGTAGDLAVFSGGGGSIANSANISESGSTVTDSGNLSIQGNTGLTLGVASSQTGLATFNNGTNNYTTTLQSGVPGSSSLTFTLPTSEGGSGQCLTTDGSVNGVLSFATCLSGSGPGGGVASLNSLSGAIAIADATGSGSTVTIQNASTSALGLSEFNSSYFSVTGGDVSLATTGVTANTYGGSTTGVGIFTVNAEGQITSASTSTLANAALQNSSVTINSSSNLTGGGAVALGGTLNLAVSSSPTFSGNLTVQGSTGATIGSTTNLGILNLLDGTSDGFSGKVELSGAIGANQTYQLPTTGGTICVSGVNCASGAGKAVLLQPGSVQTDTGSGSSIFFNNTGGGNLLELQGSGSDKFTVANNGNTTIGGSLTVSTIGSGSGSNLGISAGGSNTVGFTSDGISFSFPTSGGASQIICTTGISCASGGGQAVILQPGSVQLDTGSGSSIFFNNTGGGNLLELQGSGSDKFTVANNGNTTIGGSLTVSTIGSGSGSNLGISAGGSNTVGFTSDGISFSFPTSGGASQIICTTGISCASGGGQAVILQPGSVQLDTGSGSSIFFNNTGGGNLLELQGSGSDKFTVANNGNTTIGGSLTVQGTGVTVGSTSNNGVLSFLDGTSDGFTGKIELNGAIGANQTYQLPAASGGIICLNTGNCAGAGGGITGSGTAGDLAVFSGGGGSIANSANISESGSTVTDSGNLSIQGNTGLTLGVASSQTGLATFNNGTNNYTTTLQSGVPGSSSLTFTLPTSEGGSGQCLTTDGSVNGVLSFATCLSGSGPGGGVASLNSLSGAIAIADATGSGSTVTIQNASTSALGLSEFNSSYFSVTGGDVSLATTGVTANTYGGSTTGVGIFTVNAEGQITSASTSTLANAALQNSSVTINSSSNLTGGGAVALGGTLNLAVSSSPTFSGNLTVQGSTGATIGSTTNLGILNLLDGTSDGFSGKVELSGAIGANQTYQLPTTGGTICVQGVVSCAGSGGITGSGTAGDIAIFTGSGSTIGNSVNLSEVGSTINDSGGLTVATLATGGTSVLCYNSSTSALSVCGSSAGSGSYIYNQITQQSNANIDVEGSTGTVTEQIQGAANQNILNIYCNTGTTGCASGSSPVDYVNDLGGFVTSTTSTSAFQIQNVSGGPSNTLLNADTTNMRLGVDVTYASMAVPSISSVITTGFAGSLAASTNYYYKITAVDANGGETTPSSQAGVTTSSATNNYNTITWAPVAGAVAYHIYRSTSSGVFTGVGYYSTIGTVSGSNLTFTDIGANENNTSATPPSNSSAYVATNVSNTDNLELSIGGNGTPTGQLYVSGTLPTAAVGSINTGTSSGPDFVYVQGSYAYVTNGATSTLSIFNVSSPANPTSVGSVSTGAGSNPTSVYVQGNYAYVTTNSKLAIFNISNPGSPVSVGSVSGGSFSSVYVQGNYAYVANYLSSTLQVFNISNPANPTSVGSVSTGSGAPYSVYVKGNYAYVISNGAANTLTIYNITNPASPTLVGTITTGVTPRSVYVQGNYAYVANSGSNTLTVYNVSNPASPTSVGSVSTVTTPYSVYVQGNYAYVIGAASNSSLGVYNITNPASPTSVGSLNIGNGGGESIYVQGRYAYVVSTGYIGLNPILQIFDLGGEYTQQLQAGGIETSTLQVDSNASISGDENIQGGLTVGQNAEIDGNLGVSGSVDLQNSTNSNAAMQVANASGTVQLNVDTTNNRVGVGQLIAPPLVLDIPSAGGSLPASTTYYFKVTSLDAAGGQSAPSTEVSNSTSGTCTASGNCEIILTFTNQATTGAYSYRIYYGTSSGGEANYFTSTTNTYNFSTTSGSTSGSPPATGNAYANQLSASIGGTNYLANTIITSGSNSTTAFQIQNASGTSILTGDTTNNRIDINNGLSGNIATSQLYVGGQTPNEIGFSNTGLSSPWAVSVEGNYAYVTSASGSTLTTYNVANPASPTELASVGTGLSGPRGLFVLGHYAYIPNYVGNTMVIYNIANPSSPSEVSSVSAGLNEPENVYVQGNYAYVTNYGNSSLVIYNISNPASPTEVSSSTTGLSLAYSIYVQGNYAYITNFGSAALIVYNISNPASPSEVSSSTTNLSEPASVYVQGNYAYVANEGNNDLTIFNIANPTSISEVGVSSTGLSAPTSVYVQGRYAYVASSAKLSVFDVSTPSSPTSVGSTATLPNGSGAVYVQGRYAYVASVGVSQLTDFDLGGSYIQQLQTGGIDTGTLNVDTDANIDGDLGIQGGLSVGANTGIEGNLGVGGAALFEDQTNSTTAFQVQNTAGTNLLQIDTSGDNINLGGTIASTTVNIGSVGSVAFANTVNIGTSSGAAQTVNIGSTASSSALNLNAGTGSINLSTGTSIGNINLITNNASSSIIAKSSTNSATAFQIQNTSSVSILTGDTTNSRIDIGTIGTASGQLYVSGVLPTGITGSVYDPNTPEDVYVQGSYAYVVNAGNNTLQIFNVSNPASPVSVGSVSTGTGSDPFFLYVSGNYAYVTNSGTNTLAIYNVSNPAAPASVGSVSTGADPLGVYVSGNYAYVVNSTAPSTLAIYNVSNPASPVSVGSVSTGTNPEDVYVQGNYAYVVGLSGTLQIYNVSNPASPSLAGSVSAGTFPLSVYVQGNYAYVTNDLSSTLQIFNVSNPASPVSVGSVATQSQPQSVYVQGNYAYVTATGTGNLQIFNVSNPASPVSVGSLLTGTGTRSIFVQGNYAYLFTSYGLNTVYVGGTYSQSLQAGGIQTNTLNVVSDSNFGGDVGIQGGLTVGTNAEIGGSLGVSGNAIAATLQSASLDTINSGGTLTIGGTNASTVNIGAVGSSTNATSVNIATSTGAAQTVTIGSTNVGSTLALQGGGGITANALITQAVSSSTTGTISLLGQSATNTNTTAGSTTVNAHSITLSGTANSNVGANILNGINFNSVTAATNNTFNGLFFGSGYTNFINTPQFSISPGTYNGLAGAAIQSASGNTLTVEGNSASTATEAQFLQTNSSQTIASFVNTSGNTVASITGGTTSSGALNLGSTGNFTGNLVFQSSVSSSGTVTLTSAVATSGASYILQLPTTAAPLAGGSYGGQCVITATSSTSTQDNLTFGNCGTTHTKTVQVSAEYPGAVLDSANDTNCSSNNTGTMISGYTGDSAPQNYYEWNSGQTSLECYDIVVQVPIPSDWASWSAAPTISGEVTSGASVHVEFLNQGGTADTSCSGSGANSSGSNWCSVGMTGTYGAHTLSNTLAGTYSAGQTMTIKLELATASGGAGNAFVGNISIPYTSAY